MKSILTYKDPHLGTGYIVIPKIREISKGLGSVVVIFDNGDKRNIDSPNPGELLQEIRDAIEVYYSK